MSQRSSHWSLTVNNPTAADYEQINLARQRGWKITGQQEVGAEGTPHLQLHLATPQVRFAAVKKVFTRAHIEPARNMAALEAYVNKEETRAGALPVANEMYPSLSKFWQLCYSKLVEWNWLLAGDDGWWKEAYSTLDYRPYYQRENLTQAENYEFAMLVLKELFRVLIREGYHVDQYWSPPVQNLWKNFHFAILVRATDEITAQTDSQSDARSELSVEVPMVEHNHAVCPSPPPSASHCPYCRQEGIPPPPPGPTAFCPHYPPPT